MTQLLRGMHYSHAPLQAPIWSFLPAKPVRSVVLRSLVESVRHNLSHWFHTFMTHMTVEVMEDVRADAIVRSQAAARRPEMACTTGVFRALANHLVFEASLSTIPDGFNCLELFSGTAFLLTRLTARATEAGLSQPPPPRIKMLR